MRKYMFFTVFAAALFVLTNIVVAETGSATISDLEGVVQVKKADSKHFSVASVDMVVLPGDEIQTQTNSSVDLVFDDDNTLLKISQNSHLIIRTVEKTDNKRVSFIDLLSGNATTIINKDPGTQYDYQIKTPTTSAAVKGTEFTVETGEKNDYIGVYSGVVNVSGHDEKGNKIYEIAVEKEQEIKATLYQKAYDLKPLSARFQEIKAKLPEIRKGLATFRELRKSGEMGKIRFARIIMRARKMREFFKDNPELYKNLPEEKKAKIDKLFEAEKKLKDFNFKEIEQKYPDELKKVERHFKEEMNDFRDKQTDRLGTDNGPRDNPGEGQGPRRR